MTGINLNVVGDVVVFTDVKVPVNTCYAPYTGEKIDFNDIGDMDTSYTWQV
jgi:hypothetical protein